MEATAIFQLCADLQLAETRYGEFEGTVHLHMNLLKSEHKVYQKDTFTFEMYVTKNLTSSIVHQIAIHSVRLDVLVKGQKGYSGIKTRMDGGDLHIDFVWDD